MMTGLGYPVDVTGVAQVYAGLIDALVIDAIDGKRFEALASQPHAPASVIVTDTIMRDDASRRALALAALGAGDIRP
jgi:hypothetical protein